MGIMWAHISHGLHLAAALEVKLATIDAVATGIISVKLHRVGDHAGPANVGNQQNTVKLMDKSNLSQPSLLSNIQVASHQYNLDANGLLTASFQLLEHFQSTGNLADIDNAISNLQKAVKLIDDGNLDKPISLSHLGNSQQIRF